MQSQNKLRSSKRLEPHCLSINIEVGNHIVDGYVKDISTEGIQQVFRNGAIFVFIDNNLV